MTVITHDSPLAPPLAATPYTSLATPSRSLSWAAIFGGLVAAMALQVLFMMLGAGLGFAIYNPVTSDNPISSLGTGAMIIQGMSAMVSLWFGGWVAGRFAPIGVRASAWLHGFIVWCAATVAGVLFVSLGAGWALGDLSKMVGGGLSAAGQPAAMVASGATDMAADALKQSGDTLASYTEEALGDRPDRATGSDIRAKREIGLAVARLFNPMNEATMSENRAALVTLLVEQGGMTEPAATKMVADWTASYERLKADLNAAKEAAEIKAREAADAAASALAMFSLAAFVAFSLGAVAASWGASHGSKCARTYESRDRVMVS